MMRMTSEAGVPASRRPRVRRALRFLGRTWMLFCAAYVVVATKLFVSYKAHFLHRYGRSRAASSLPDLRDPQRIHTARSVRDVTPFPDPGHRHGRAALHAIQWAVAKARPLARAAVFALLAGPAGNRQVPLVGCIAGAGEGLVVRRMAARGLASHGSLLPLVDGLVLSDRRGVVPAGHSVRSAEAGATQRGDFATARGRRGTGLIERNNASSRRG